MMFQLIIHLRKHLGRWPRLAGTPRAAGKAFGDARPRWGTRSRGITLIELLIYCALLGSILTVLYEFFIQVSFQRINQVTQAEIYTNGRRLLFDFGQTIKTASAISQPSFGQAGSTLNLDSGRVVYALQQGRLVKTENGEANFLTDKQVVAEQLSFSHLGPSSAFPTIKISFILKGRHLTEGGKEKRETFQIAVSLR